MHATNSQQQRFKPAGNCRDERWTRAMRWGTSTLQGAVLARMPITEGWSVDALTVVATGDTIRVDPQQKTITVLMSQ